MAIEDLFFWQQAFIDLADEEHKAIERIQHESERKRNRGRRS